MNRTTYVEMSLADAAIFAQQILDAVAKVAASDKPAGYLYVHPENPATDGTFIAVRVGK